MRSPRTAAPGTFMNVVLAYCMIPRLLSFWDENIAKIFRSTTQYCRWKPCMWHHDGNLVRLSFAPHQRPDDLEGHCRRVSCFDHQSMFLLHILLVRRRPVWGHCRVDTGILQPQLSGTDHLLRYCTTSPRGSKMFHPCHQPAVEAMANCGNPFCISCGSFDLPFVLHHLPNNTGKETSNKSWQLKQHISIQRCSCT